MNAGIRGFVCLFLSLTVPLSLSLCLAARAAAQERPTAESATESATESTPPAVAATVGDEAVSVSEAQRMLDDVFHDRKKPAADVLPMLQAQALEEVIKQRLALAYARRVGEFPSSAELTKAEKQYQIQLAAQGRKVADVLKAKSMTLTDLKRQVVWRLVWDRYLARYCTPERRETWFEAHHADVDGTELAVSHILLRPAAGAGPKQFEELEKQAEAIRTEITSGRLDFSAAAEKYSAGPSAKQGGRLGKIGRHGPMEEAFSRAAFQLQAGQISPPVRSPFGVHLIRCDEVVPGKKTAADLTGPIDDALAKELLEKLSRLERAKTPVKYTSAWPHFKPGTQELAK
jgi:parvulin-like peptidyl-prolyl isomerase